MIDEPSQSLLDTYPAQHAAAPPQVGRMTPRYETAAPLGSAETLIDRFWRIVRN